jgi:hypothetical protein
MGICVENYVLGAFSHRPTAVQFFSMRGINRLGSI